MPEKAPPAVEAKAAGEFVVDIYEIRHNADGSPLGESDQPWASYRVPGVGVERKGRLVYATELHTDIVIPVSVRLVVSRGGVLLAEHRSLDLAQGVRMELAEAAPQPPAPPWALKGGQRLVFIPPASAVRYPGFEALPTRTWAQLNPSRDAVVVQLRLE